MKKTFKLLSFFIKQKPANKTSEIAERFDTIAAKLPKEEYNKDTISLINEIRKKYKGVTPKVVDYNELPVEEKTGAIYQLGTISQDKYFNMVCDQIINSQKEIIALRAEDYDSVMFGRTTINGIELLREVLADAEAQSEELRKKGENFDKFKILSE